MGGGFIPPSPPAGDSSSPSPCRRPPSSHGEICGATLASNGHCPQWDNHMQDLRAKYVTVQRRKGPSTESLVRRHGQLRNPGVPQLPPRTCQTRQETAIKRLPLQRKERVRSVTSSTSKPIVAAQPRFQPTGNLLRSPIRQINNLPTVAVNRVPEYDVIEPPLSPIRQNPYPGLH